MHRARPLGVAACGLVALLSSALAVDAAPATSRQDAVAGSGAQATEAASEYVVAYEGDATAAAQAITAAGGQVVDVNDTLDIALVTTSDGNFVGNVVASDAITGAVRNHSVGLSDPSQPHRFVEERPSDVDRSQVASAGSGQLLADAGDAGTEPLADRQWDMDMINTPQAHTRATGEGVRVGIIDTGIDGSHPDIAANFDAAASRNFTTDIPAVDGPCEVPGCVDPADTDDNGHGTHVSGTVAATRNGLGIEGVAPDATLVNVRAGQDSGYFFLYETVGALTYAGQTRLDVVNMSFYTDPWLYNCASRDDYISGDVSDEEIAEQALIRQLLLEATAYASDRGVTLVAAAGNGHTNLALPERPDATSPDYPPGAERERVVTDNCLDLPSEAPDVISVSALGPSETKADYSNYGLDDVEISAPGGWFRDFVGTRLFMTPGNMVLSSYPLHVAIAEGLARENGQPTDAFSVRDCQDRTCAFYTYLQGTSMASPHATGVAALIIQAHGRSDGQGGFFLAPGRVRQILEGTARDHACPVGGVEIYTDEGRPEEFNAVCEGTTDENGFYGEGIIDAAAATA